MSIISVIGSLSDLTATIQTTAATTNVDTNVAKEGILCHSGSSGSVLARRTLLTPLTDFWINFRTTLQNLNTNSSFAIVAFYDTTFSVSQPLFRLFKSSSSYSVDGAVLAQYWNGSSYTSIGAGPLHGSGTGIEETIRIKMDNSTGVFARYRDTVLDGSFSGDTILTAGTAIDRIEFSAAFSANLANATYSEIIIADEDTRGFRLQRIEPTGNGANTTWTGVFSDVDETGINDADYIVSTAADQIETYTCADIYSGLASLPVKAVIVSVRARKGGTGPQNLQGAVRLSSVDYFSSNLTTLNTAFQGGIQAVWMVNPATSLAWTQAEINGAEIGVKSIA